MRSFFYAAIFSLLSACATTKLPLCPAIAGKSYANPTEDKALGMLLEQEIKKREIAVSQLSWFAAEFSGKSSDISWLSRNYPEIICSFDPKIKKIYIRETYTSCMAHANQWITAIQAGRPESLMLQETRFFEICAQPE